MGGWLRNRFGRTVAVGTLAVAGVGGLAYAVAGPLTSSTVAATGGNRTTLQGTGTSAGPSCPATSGAPGGSAGAGSSTATSARSTAIGCGGTNRRALIRRLLARTSHASLTIKDKAGQWVTVDLDRGTATAVSSTSITLLRPDGVSVTATVDSATRFVGQAASSLAVGDRVVVVQESGAARYVLVGKPAGAKSGKPAKAGRKTTSTASISVA